MMGKISKGGSFGGCVDYVTRKKKDNPDGTPCNEWRLITRVRDKKCYKKVEPTA